MTRPNIVILTIGRTGSTILCRMLEQLGWNLPEADEYAEHVRFREINEIWLRQRKDIHGSCNLIDELPEPWILKDPRLPLCWNLWKDQFNTETTALLWLTRNHADIASSLLKQGWGQKTGNSVLLRGMPLARIDEMCEEIYDSWSGLKLRLDYAQLQAATTLFASEIPTPGQNFLSSTATC